MGGYMKERSALSDTRHFINLSNGLQCVPLCQHTGAQLHDYSYVRLQSTWCEQKRWSDVLMSLGADLYFNLAVLSSDELLAVHDVSKRDRETRPYWQGLSLVRYVTSLAWFDVERVERSRNGMDVNRYWYNTWCQLPRETKLFVRYFKKYVPADASADCVDGLKSCYSLRGEA